MPKIKQENTYSHFEFRKKFRNQFQVKQIVELAIQWGISAQDVCYRLITEGIQREIAKKKEIEELKSKNRQ